jgi:hypothetical protein
VGKGRIHVSIDETLLEALRVRASKLHCHQSDVITMALQRELSLELFDQTLDGRLDLEDEPVVADVQRARPAVPEPEPDAHDADEDPAGITAETPAISWPGT